VFICGAFQRERFRFFTTYCSD